MEGTHSQISSGNMESSPTIPSKKTSDQEQIFSSQPRPFSVAEGGSGAQSKDHNDDQSSNHLPREEDLDLPNLSEVAKPELGVKNEPHTVKLDRTTAAVRGSADVESRHISVSALPEVKHAWRPHDGGAEKLLLPAFANQANRELAAAIQQLEKGVDGTERELDQNVQRTSQMSKYLRSLQLELASKESRLEAKTKELHTEQHLQKLNHHEQV